MQVSKRKQPEVFENEILNINSRLEKKATMGEDIYLTLPCTMTVFDIESIAVYNNKRGEGQKLYQKKKT